MLSRAQYDHLKMRMMDVMRQKGADDCGLFAIAFAVDLCNGDDPAKVNYKQVEMRKHLVQCLKNGVMLPFPRKSNASRRKAGISEVNVSLHCMCHLPDDGRLMVCCDNCSRWFHTRCVRMTVAAAKSKKSRLCEDCRQ